METLAVREVPENLDRLGEAIAVVGDIVVAGAPGRDGDSGGASVFAWDGFEWVENSVIAHPNPAPLDAFGDAIAAAGEVVVVGAPLDGAADVGSAHVFTLQSGSLVFTATIPHPTGQADSEFGASIDLAQTTTGDYLAIIGAPRDDAAEDNAGAAYVFEAQASDLTSWSLVATLQAPSPAELDAFGAAVSISEDHAVVGMHRAIGGGVNLAGAAVVFDRIGGVWQTTGTVLSPSMPQAGAEFGYSVAIDGDTIIIGAPSTSIPGAPEEDTGAAETFQLIAGSWVADALLEPFDCTTCELKNGRFGHAVDVLGDDIVIGAPSATSGARGAAHRFARLGGSWTEIRRSVAADDFYWTSPGSVGQSVFIGDHPGGGTFAAVGAPSRFLFLADRTLIYDGGAIIAPRLIDPSESDCDQNGVADACELGPGTDCNQNGVLDSCDIAEGASVDEDGDGIPDECTLDPLVEIVWLIDDSGSVGFEPEEVCELVTGVTMALESSDVRHRVFTRSIGPTAASFLCIAVDDAVVPLYGDQIPDPAPCCPEIDSQESWAGAAAIASRNHPWTGGAVRVVIAVSDECPWEGGPSCDGEDDAALDAAIDVLDCDATYGFTVSSIDATAAATERLQKMAEFTNGRWVQLDDAGGTPIQDAIEAIVESVTLRSRRYDADANGMLDRVQGFGFPPAPLIDCNDNGIDDLLEIAIDVDDGVPDSVYANRLDGNLNGLIDICEDLPCAHLGDLDGSRFVGFGDLLELLNAWGPCPAPPADCPADLDGNGDAGFGDLVIVLTNWGWCPLPPIEGPCDVRLGTETPAPQSIWDCYARTGGDPDKLAACIEAMLLAGTP